MFTKLLLRQILSNFLKSVIYIGCYFNSPRLIAFVFILSSKKINNIKYKSKTKKKIIYFYRSVGITDLLHSYSIVSSDNILYSLERGLLVVIFNYFTGKSNLLDFDYYKNETETQRLNYRKFLEEILMIIKKEWKLGGIITSGIFMKSDHELIAATDNLKIPFVIMQKEGIRSYNERLVEDYYLKYKIPNFKGTKVLVYNKDEIKSYLKTGYAKKSQIEVTGCARFDTFFELRKLKAKEKTIAFFLIQNDYGLPIQSGKWFVPKSLKKKIKDKKFSWEIIEKKYFKLIEDFIKNNKDYKIIIKTKNFQALSQNQIKFLEKIENENVKILSGGNSYNTIKNSRIIVSFSSTVMFEALASERILITPYDFVSKNKFKYLLDIEGCYLPSNWIGQNKLTKLKKNNINIKKRNKVFNKYMGNIDGKSGIRVGKTLNNIFQNYKN